MLNLLVVEGIVTNRIWNFNGQVYCRLAIYPDNNPDNHNGQPAGRDPATFVTVRFPPAKFPLNVREGMHVRVQGSLGTSDEVLTLNQWVPGSIPGRLT
jgi:hypothetical protein